MTPDDLDAYVRDIGYTVDVVNGDDGNPYTVIRGVEITKGTLRGKVCDIAIARPVGLPYVLPSAIHTRPALLPMGQYNTQASGVGSDWQYWSRRLDRAPTPQQIWIHVLTILGEV